MNADNSPKQEPSNLNSSESSDESRFQQVDVGDESNRGDFSPMPDYYLVACDDLSVE